jgi:hypothetical protein
MSRPHSTYSAVSPSKKTSYGVNTTGLSRALTKSCWLRSISVSFSSGENPYIGHGLIVRAEEEDADACEPCLYDPALFTSTATHPSSPLLHTFSHDSDRDKVSLVVFFFHATHLYAVLFESLCKLVHLFLYVFERAIGVFLAFVAQRRVPAALDAPRHYPASLLGIASLNQLSQVFVFTTEFPICRVMLNGSSRLLR